MSSEEYLASVHPWTNYYEQAYEYLQLALRQYVTAVQILDKLFAIRLVVVSMSLGVDALLTYYPTTTTTHQVPRRPSNSPVAMYEQRLVELRQLEEQFVQQDLSSSFEYAVKVLAGVERPNPYPTLLGLNFKAFMNAGHDFLVEVSKHISSDE